MDNSGYTVIQDWMLDLGMTLSETVVYAIIYGFSQDHDSAFTGSRKYIARRSMCSVRQIDRILATLVKKGMLIRIDTYLKGTKTPEYQAVVPNVAGGVILSLAREDNLSSGVDNMSLKSRQNVTQNKRENKDIYNPIYNLPLTENSLPQPPTPSPSPRVGFARPTLDDVKAYCTERNNNVDADNFVDFYESNGWMVGKNPMKDWKAAVRTWERNRIGQTTSSQHGKDRGYTDAKQHKGSDYETGF